jgi:hypothetical protein
MASPIPGQDLPLRGALAGDPRRRARPLLSLCQGPAGPKRDRGDGPRPKPGPPYLMAGATNKRLRRRTRTR